MKSLMFTLLVVTMTFSSNSAAKNTRQWCKGFLPHLAVVQDSQGALYVMDGMELRQIADQSLLKWYKLNQKPRCILASSQASQYRHGQSIEFRPDKDLQTPFLLKVSNDLGLYLWYRGQLHELNVNKYKFRVFSYQPSQISPLVYRALPKGKLFTKKTIIEGTLIKKKSPRYQCKSSQCRYNNHVYIYTRYGIRKIPKRHLDHIDLAPYSPVILKSSTVRKLQAKANRKPLRLLNKTRIPSGILIRGSHPKRIYLLKNKTRYHMWSTEAINRLKIKNKAITQIPDDELYLFPFGGTLY